MSTSSNISQSAYSPSEPETPQVCFTTFKYNFLRQVIKNNKKDI